LSIVLLGCTKKETTQTSSEARVNTFTFYEDTINPGLTEVTYKIEHSSDTGLIYNRDSLRFGTRLDSVVPYVTYKATPGKVEFILPDTIIVSTGGDTIDLTKSPVYLHVTSSDLENEQWYRIQLTVHQVDPDLYVWSQLTQQIFAPQNCETKAIWQNGQLILYVNNGFSTTIYRSSNGISWTNIGPPEGLPTPCYVREIMQHNDALYYIDNDKLYQSLDHTHWLTTDYTTASFTPIVMLMSFNNQAWCIVQDRKSLAMQLATIHDTIIEIKTDIQGLENGILPELFPVSDFAALAFESSSERPRAMVIGGRTQEGEAVNTRWNFEYNTYSGYRMKDFSIEQPHFNSLTGISVIQYDGHLIMYGGIDNDQIWRSNMLFSDDEGMNWYEPDTAHNKLPDNYQTRQKQSVVVDNHNNIYIIGGQSQTETFSDVYRGFLNSINW
jgi:hypothetical protein